MHSVRLAQPADFGEWRDRARGLLQAGIAPADVSWLTGDDSGGLFGDDAAPVPAPPGAPAASVPRDFLALADTALAHHDPQRFGLLYRLLWRITHGEPQLLGLITDDDVVRVRAMEKSVRRDKHKMTAFVRFREVATEDGSVFVAWFEPEHYIVERTAPFFVRRFAGMRWSILTPYRSAHWDGQAMRFTPGASKRDAPDGDAMETLWRTYYASIFNPARLKVQAMKSEMPVKYWKNLPEARLIPTLIRDALPRAQQMVQKQATLPSRRMAGALPQKPAADAPPLEGSLQQLHREAQDCRRCALWQPATQTVFGSGPEQARVMFIGEQPGDQEDLAGQPFVGPAGKLLDRALQELGLDRAQFYITNTVKHFKFEPRGKTRLHQRADAREQAACKPWLDAELQRVQPAIVVCLGAMAAQAVFGASFRLLQQRGAWQALGPDRRGFATVHPAYLLRLPDEAARRQGYADFVRDLSLLV